MQIIEQSTQLKKHIGTVHIAAPLSLLQRKAFSVLLFNAYPKLKTERTHTIAIDALCELLGYDSKDVGSLKSALRFLVTTPIEWVGADSDKWAMTTFLSFVQVKGGNCTYRYDEFLAEQLYQPEVYARINLGALRHFQSKYAVALYENCARYRPNGSFPGGTPEWSLEEFRLIMGVRDMPLFQEFKRINAKVIQPSIREINTYSDIVLTPILRKEGRTFVSIRFDVKDNPQMSFNFVSEEPTVQTGQDHPGVIKMRDRYGVPEGIATTLLNVYGPERFQQVLELTDDMASKEKLLNPVGYINWAFETGAVKGRDPEEIQKEVQEEKAKRKGQQKRSKKKPVLEKEVRAKLDSLYEKHLSELARSRLSALSTEQQNALLKEWFSAESFMQQKFRGVSSLEKLGTGTVFFINWLMKHWSLETVQPFATWQDAEGYQAREAGDVIIITKHGSPVP